MIIRLEFAILLASITASATGAALRAQTPRAYSFTAQNSMTVPNLAVKVFRDGHRELIDQSLAVSEGSPKGMHAATLYDFQTHTSYTWDLINPALPCNVATYDKPEAPAMYDVISGAAENAAEVAKLHPKTVGAEVVNGIPATSLEVSDSTGQVTVRIWMATKGGYLVKWLGIAKAGPPQVRMEIRELRLEKPRASLLAVPAKCAGGAHPSPAS
jgi:hypothetical protein